MKSEMTFNPSRLKLARARRMLTMKALAEAVGMTSKMISNYEHGRNDVPEETLERISRRLGYPKDFFYGESLDELDPEWVSFRSMKGMKAAQRDAALSAGSIAILFSEWLESEFHLPDTNLEDLRTIEPEVAARTLREKWGIGEKSISNMIHLLESKGIRVFSLAESYKEVDAYSFWKDEKAYVFLNTYKSAERSRFDAAHELGHLVLHKHGGPVGREAEQDADRFASAFLMPAASVLSNAPSFASINNLIKLKRVWLVSLSSLVRRLKDLNVITEWQYRTLNIEMSKLGMLKNEPEGIKQESSLILGKVFRVLRDNGVTRLDIARKLVVPVEELDALVFRLAFIGSLVAETGIKKKSSDRKADLKLVQ